MRLAIDWLATRELIDEAQPNTRIRHNQTAFQSRALLVPNTGVRAKRRSHNIARSTIKAGTGFAGRYPRLEPHHVRPRQNGFLDKGP